MPSSEGESAGQDRGDPAEGARGGQEDVEGSPGPRAGHQGPAVSCRGAAAPRPPGGRAAARDGAAVWAG